MNNKTALVVFSGGTGFHHLSVLGKETFQEVYA